MDTESVGIYLWENLGWWYHPVIQIIFTFILAFVLSPISLGFFFFLLIYLVFEIIFAMRIGFKYDNCVIVGRFSIFLAGIFGFIVGRTFLMEDGDPFRHSFHEWL